MCGGKVAQERADGEDVREEHIGGRMRLAGDDGAIRLPRRHCPLEAREEGEGGRVTLTGTGWPLHEQRRQIAARADESPLACLEIVERARRVERVQPGEE